MNAIVPLNVAALRVNNNDSTNVVGGFQGTTADFSAMPWDNPVRQPPAQASTGDKIYRALGNANGAPLTGPINPLDVGVHLHWQLPDYFRKGTQPAQGGNIVFPAAPNRWLVTRFLSFLDPSSQSYGPISTKSWIVESDYVSATLTTDKYGVTRPAITVPLPASPVFQKQPFMYMGRVVESEAWNPATESPGDYLPAYQGTDGQSLYLTSIGFVGAYFGSYYPECSSVFGFWDNFADVKAAGFKNLYAALQANAPIQFRATYQVTGWIDNGAADPLANIATQVTSQYSAYLNACTNNGVAPAMTPNDFFQQITSEKMKWTFNLPDVGYTLNKDQTISSLNYPQRTLSSGTTQQIVWNMITDPGTTYFLQSNDSRNGSVWRSQVEVAVGNSTEEAVATMLRSEMQEKTSNPVTLANYEYLIEALQMGLLAGLENTPNQLISLEEALHTNTFAAQPGGYEWVVGRKETSGENDDATDPDTEVTLPLDLAEQLYLLNQAQKDYDMGRAALTVMRQQLFMDWTHYVKLATGEITDPNITLANMTNFIATSSGGELNAVIAKGTAVGILTYSIDSQSGAVTGINPPAASVATTSLAAKLWNQYNVVQTALQDFLSWQLQCAKSEAFYLPREPVLLLQGDMIEPAARNGQSGPTFVRLSPEILNQLNVVANGTTFNVPVSALSGVPAIPSATPMPSDVAALAGEAYLIIPMLAPLVAGALGAMGGANNPATASVPNFTTALTYAQGGLSSLDVTPAPGGVPPAPATSLFATVQADDYQPAANPSVNVTAPQALTIAFTNASNNGWAPSAVAWTTQSTPAGFPTSQVNPFLPVFMIWNVALNPLKSSGQDAHGNAAYSPTNLTEFFTLNTDAVGYEYRANDGTPVDFTTKNAVPYGDSATMNSNSTGVLVYQISSYIGSHPGDDDNPTLQSIADFYKTKRYLAQSISGFNNEQALRSIVAQVAVSNLTKGKRDLITAAVALAAGATPGDNWYDFGFNALAPISSGLLAETNFGPLRSGFLEIVSLELVDAFGQRMNLLTEKFTADHSLTVATSQSLTPPDWDTANAGRIYLPPRLLAPTRLRCHWMSAYHDSAVTAVTADFEAMGDHPAVSPVCGWIVPNHLDNNLFFYDADGAAIGTFGLENLATTPVLQYRTRAGNLANPNNDLALDIGPTGASTVNPHVALFMRNLNGQKANYLRDLIQVILKSASFIKPVNDAHNANLSVLLGRPLALTRAVVGLETAGNLLPISQASTTANDPLPQDVNNNRVDYTARMATSSANLPQVNFPLRLGDLANLDDGLVGYLVEATGDDPYANASLYAPAATDKMTSGVTAPAETNLQLQLNGAPLYLTLLVDPRAPVHATTGILPVLELAIPPDQYSAAMQNLALTFTARPMLQTSRGPLVPLPAASGYDWSWITPGAAATAPLTSNAANETPAYGYSPQSLQEGWLKLSPSSESS